MTEYVWSIIRIAADGCAMIVVVSGMALLFWEIEFFILDRLFTKLKWNQQVFLFLVEKYDKKRREQEAK